MNVNESVLRSKVDPFLTRDNLNRICSKALGQNVTLKNTSVLTGGCLNRIIGIEFDQEQPELVLKISPDSKNIDLKHEYKVLQYFRKNTNLSVPEPVYFCDHDEFIPGVFFLMTRLSGTILLHAGISSPDMERILFQLAHEICILHEKKNEGFGGVEHSQKDLFKNWSDFWIPRFNAAVSDVKASGRVDPGIFMRIDKVRSHFNNLLDIGQFAVLTHYDIWAGNILVDKIGADFRITGFLDLQGYWADYAREISFMEMFGMIHTSFYDIYQASHSFDDGFHVRKDLYNLKMHLKHIKMYPDQSYYRIGAERCLSRLENTFL